MPDSGDDEPPDDDSADEHPSPLMKKGTPAIARKNDAAAAISAAAAAPLPPHDIAPPKTPITNAKIGAPSSTQTLPPQSVEHGMGSNGGAALNAPHTFDERYARLEARCAMLEQRDAKKDAILNSFQQRLAALEQQVSHQLSQTQQQQALLQQQALEQQLQMQRQQLAAAAAVLSMQAPVQVPPASPAAGIGGVGYASAASMASPNPMAAVMALLQPQAMPEAGSLLQPAEGMASATAAAALPAAPMSQSPAQSPTQPPAQPNPPTPPATAQQDASAPSSSLSPVPPQPPPPTAPPSAGHTPKEAADKAPHQPEIPALGLAAALPSPEPANVVESASVEPAEAGGGEKEDGAAREASADDATDRADGKGGEGFSADVGDYEDGDGDGVPDSAAPMLLIIDADGDGVNDGLHSDKLGLFIPQQGLQNERPWYRNDAYPTFVLWNSGGKWWVGKDDQLGKNRGWFKVSAASDVPPKAGWQVYDKKAASCLRWIELGSAKPERGAEIANAGLASALQKKQLEFTQAEYNEFGVTKEMLRSDSFVAVTRAGKARYFRPAPAWEKLDDMVCSFAERIQLGGTLGQPDEKGILGTYVRRADAWPLGSNGRAVYLREGFGGSLNLAVWWHERHWIVGSKDDLGKGPAVGWLKVRTDHTSPVGATGWQVFSTHKQSFVDAPSQLVCKACPKPPMSTAQLP